MSSPAKLIRTDMLSRPPAPSLVSDLSNFTFLAAAIPTSDIKINCYNTRAFRQIAQPWSLPQQRFDLEGINSIILFYQ
ncbi:hypothetical protein JAAARDRAFT_191845 [Jaapia argillacea MUCL 33604]|uniref:Uncharacterized protein n=1 Tax=Jaapia argillacea MUCL 33604 TaxID=933084 RepID=A0A067Q088_9AGAM|nr:hypothetical protein JAAARDRAFT_191845 [Jaapia argillacea MUCL 33604]